MINLLHVAAFIAAFGFLVLSISLAVMFWSLKDTLKIVAGTLEDVSGQMEGITRETTELLHKTNELTADIQGKTEKLDTVFDALQGVGKSVGELNSSMNEVSHSVVHEANKNSDKIAQAVQWGTVLINLFQKARSVKEDERGWKRYDA